MAVDDVAVADAKRGRVVAWQWWPWKLERGPCAARWLLEVWACPQVLAVYVFGSPACRVLVVVVSGAAVGCT